LSFSKRKNASLIQGIEAKSRKNAIFATFRFNTQAFPESGKHFFSDPLSLSKFTMKKLKVK
jgi:hypothetical protein